MKPQKPPPSDRERFKSQFGRWPTEEEAYEFTERLGSLCGSMEPTEQEIRIAVNQVRETAQRKEIYGTTTIKT